MVAWRTIGRFARLAGLSVGALRHDDELDLRRPDRGPDEPTDPVCFRWWGE